MENKPLLLFICLLFLAVSYPHTTSAEQINPSFIKTLTQSADTTLRAITQPQSVSLQNLFSSTELLASVKKSNDTPPNVLTENELIVVTRPAIARIISHIKGTILIPAFDIDFRTFSLTLLDPKKNPPHSKTIDTYFTGSGFVVSSEGFLLTNSHVISEDILGITLASQMLSDAFQAKLKSMSPSEIQEIETLIIKKGLSQEDARAIGVTMAMKGIETLRRQTRYQIVKQVAVVKPNQDSVSNESSAFATRIAENADIKGEAAKLMKTGYSAAIVRENTSFMDDERDVAVLKISQNKLPYVTLSHTEDIRPGKSIFAFGYPTNAEYGIFDVEPSFTKGAVSSLKSSNQHNFKFIQSDVKISRGSSGGPLFNDHGEVIGIITAQTNPGKLAEGGGDNFATALPISIALEELKKAGVIIPTANEYRDDFLSALISIEVGSCKKALPKLELSKTYNSALAPISELIDPFIAKCNALITSGNSIDSAWDSYKNIVTEIDLWVWVVGIGVVAGITILVVGAFFLIKRIRRDERLINQLEQRTLQNEKTSPAPERNESQDHSTLIHYITQARVSKMPDPEIRSSLLKEKWDPLEVEKILKQKS